MRLTAIALRALFAFVFLLLILRISGKRTIGQASPIDLLAALILGDLIDDPLWGEVSAAQFVVAAGVLMLAHVCAAVGATVSPFLEWLVEGRPMEVVQDGALLPAGMRRERVSELEVAALLREDEISDLREVRSGILEASGELSVLQRDWAKEAQKQDLERVREAVR
jgi:uncharacterized membrane protein YcaP (DUF421 family)